MTDAPNPIVDLGQVEQLAARLTSGEQPTVDLSGLVHDRAVHAELVPLSVLAWFLLSTDQVRPDWTVVLPDAGSTPLRHIARSGVIAAATARDINLRYADGSPYSSADLHRDPAKHQARLPGVDWEVIDDGTSFDRFRLLPDLCDPRRRRTTGHDVRLAYPWLSTLGTASAAISPQGHKRFAADASSVLAELTDNVHRWSEASLAFAVVSTTRGGALTEGDDRASWNRLHIVIADNGIGIPAALHKDLAALEAVRSTPTGTNRLSDVDDHELLERLLRHAFGSRRLPNHNGHGLNAAQIRAGQWVGGLDVVTVDRAGQPFRRGSRGLDPESLETDDHALNLPNASGTLVHLLLQATDAAGTRTMAAVEEQLTLWDGTTYDRSDSELLAQR